MLGRGYLHDQPLIKAVGTESLMSLLGDNILRMWSYSVLEEWSTSRVTLHRARTHGSSRCFPLDFTPYLSSHRFCLCPFTVINQGPEDDCMLAVLLMNQQTEGWSCGPRNTAGQRFYNGKLMPDMTCDQYGNDEKTQPKDSYKNLGLQVNSKMVIVLLHTGKNYLHTHTHKADIFSF